MSGMPMDLSKVHTSSRALCASSMSRLVLLAVMPPKSGRMLAAGVELGGGCA